MSLDEVGCLEKIRIPVDVDCPAGILIFWLKLLFQFAYEPQAVVIANKNIFFALAQFINSSSDIGISCVIMKSDKSSAYYSWSIQLYISFYPRITMVSVYKKGGYELRTVLNGFMTEFLNRRYIVCETVIKNIILEFCKIIKIIPVRYKGINRNNFSFLLAQPLAPEPQCNGAFPLKGADLNDFSVQMINE